MTANDKKKMKCREVKQDVLELFRKYHLVQEGKDYEKKIRITSGNIAWININSLEIIK